MGSSAAVWLELCLVSQRGCSGYLVTGKDASHVPSGEVGGLQRQSHF